MFICVLLLTKFGEIRILVLEQALNSHKKYPTPREAPSHSTANKENNTSVQAIMTWCFGFNYETGGEEMSEEEEQDCSKVLGYTMKLRRF